MEPRPGDEGSTPSRGGGFAGGDLRRRTTSIRVMIHRVSDYDAEAPITLIDIGNTTVWVATWEEHQVKTPRSIPTDDPSAFDDAYTAHLEAMPSGSPAATVIGSVVPSALKKIRGCVQHRQDRDPLIVGETIPLPIDVAVTDAKAIGVDRVCVAAAAYDKIQGACTVIDFGTAVTIDLVDDEGTLRGGAILPGLRMQLRALHEQTALLPEVEPAIPELPYGRNTVEAMQIGVSRGLAGAVRGLVEAYASVLNHWPQVVATGGDLNLVAPQCDFLDSLVEHLTLRGIGLAYRKHMEASGA